MMKKIFVLIISLHFLPAGGVSAQQRICGTPLYHEQMAKAFPGYVNKRAEIKNILSKLKNERVNSKTLSGGFIPVVVHIIYNTAEQNIPDEQVISQINTLNEDYAATNANIAEVPDEWKPLIADYGIRFCLARQDENGNETTGITRTSTANSFFAVGSTMKYDSTGGHRAWNTYRYLNIWVCNIGDISNTVLGFAQHPGGDPQTDGVVINYVAFGRTGNLSSQYNLGRTCTHEIGHWLDLDHIWGDDGGCSLDDGISDTPKQDDASFGCPAYPEVSCNNGPGGDMFMNYMDYTDDRCMMLFTTEQMNHMNLVLLNVRDSITMSSGCIPVAIPYTDLGILSITPLGLNCNRKVIPSITLYNYGQTEITKFTFDYHVDDGAENSFQWNGSLQPDDSISVQLPVINNSDELHVFAARLTSVNMNATDDYAINNFKTQSFLIAPEKYGCPVYPETPEILIYPVPVKNIVYIETKYKEAQKATISIYNLVGKRMYSAEFENSTGETLKADVNGLPAGIYFVQVKTFNKSSGKKFVVID